MAQLRLERNAGWFHQHVVFIDPCSTVLSDSLQAGFDENHASYGKGRRRLLPDQQKSSRNLRASPYATKQTRYGDVKAWWFIVLARGKVGYGLRENACRHLPV